MKKLTKTEANYRLPDKCCASCGGSYQSTYGDSSCSTLTSGTSVDAGGVCDLWYKYVDPVPASHDE